jgi:hypothetical protein
MRAPKVENPHNLLHADEIFVIVHTAYYLFAERTES